MTLNIVVESVEVTDGRFDLTSGVIKSAFDEASSGTGRPPLPNALARSRFSTEGKKRILINKKVIVKQNAKAIIDLDSVSKGFCIDLITEALHFEGYRAFYVD